jgi:hypothetical protein
MNWLRRTVVFLALLAPASLLHACSGDDNATTTPVDLDASQPVIPKIEAGSPCATNNDCASGLVCLYPATTCQAFRVCTSAPPDPCPGAVTACSCLGDPIQVCGGFASDAVDPTGASCGDSGPVIAPEAGSDGGAGDSSLPPSDAGSDSGGIIGLDASDAAG